MYNIIRVQVHMYMVPPHVKFHNIWNCLQTGFTTFEYLYMYMET